MRKIVELAILVAVCLALAGCSMYTARFSPPFKQDTNVVLKENDFEFIERNLRGSHYYWSLQIGYVPPMALEIPLGDPRLFSNALADMYIASKEQTEGKPTQLMNWTLDSDTLLIPIPFVWPTKKTAIFRADLMEFTK